MIEGVNFAGLLLIVGYIFIEEYVVELIKLLDDVIYRLVGLFLVYIVLVLVYVFNIFS